MWTVPFKALFLKRLVPDFTHNSSPTQVSTMVGWGGGAANMASWHKNLVQTQRTRSTEREKRLTEDLVRVPRDSVALVGWTCSFGLHQVQVLTCDRESVSHHR